MPSCHCIVNDQHPAGAVWLPQSTEPCPDHRYGQRYQEAK